MTIFASCGHQLTDDEGTGIHLALKTSAIDFELDAIVPVVSYGCYCSECAGAYEREGWVCHTWEEEREYLYSDKSKWKNL